MSTLLDNLFYSYWGNQGPPSDYGEWESMSREKMNEGMKYSLMEKG